MVICRTISRMEEGETDMSTWTVLLIIYFVVLAIGWITSRAILISDPKQSKDLGLFIVIIAFPLLNIPGVIMLVCYYFESVKDKDLLAQKIFMYDTSIVKPDDIEDPDKYVPFDEYA
jgi:hypothetical protein